MGSNQNLIQTTDSRHGNSTKYVTEIWSGTLPESLQPRFGGVCFCNAMFDERKNHLHMGFPLYSRISESLLALALVKPTQYTTQLASRHYFLCPSHHNCHLRSLAELSSSSAPLWRMEAGAVSGSQHTGSGSPGGTSRSALGAIKAVGAVDKFEQA